MLKTITKKRTQTFRSGIIGAGHISEFHLRALRRIRNAQVVGVCDVQQDRAQALAARFKVANVFGCVEELLASGVDVAHVLTYPASHAEIAVKCLDAGCHVLVEKPLATSEEDCDRIIAAARRANRVVCVDHALLRDPFVVKALSAASSGKIGRVISVDYFKSQAYPPYQGGPLPVHYREGGYPFRDMGVHALYVIKELLGEIQDVSAQWRGEGDDPNLACDEWQATVRCRQGTGHIHLSWNSRPFQNLLVVRGTSGVIKADLFGMHVTTNRRLPLPGFVQRIVNANSEGWQIARQVPVSVIRVLLKKIRRYHGVQQLIEDFYANLANDEPPPASAEDARPIVVWTEHVARQADEFKRQRLARHPEQLTAPVLVTGASGFIGGHLLRRLLSENQRVRVFTRRDPPADWINEPRIEIVRGDLGDPEAVQRAVNGTETIYHVGAGIKGGVADMDRGTIVGTDNIVKSAIENQSKLVYISSISVLHAANARRGEVIREDWPLEPHPGRRGHYTRTKFEAERIVREAVSNDRLQAVILRPGLVFGPGGPLITSAVALTRNNRLIVLGSGNIILPLIYVDDLVDAIQLAAEKESCAGSILHIVDATQLTQNGLIDEYLHASGQAISVMHVPRIICNSLGLGVHAMAAVLRRSPPLSLYRIRSALAPWVFDCSDAEQQLGWKPRVGVRKGLNETLRQMFPDSFVNRVDDALVPDADRPSLAAEIRAG